MIRKQSSGLGRPGTVGPWKRKFSQAAFGGAGIRGEFGLFSAWNRKDSMSVGYLWWAERSAAAPESHGFPVGDVAFAAGFAIRGLSRGRLCHPGCVIEHSIPAGPGEPVADLTSLLTKIARTLEPDADVERTVNHIVVAAASTVPGADEAGVSMLDGSEMRSMGPSSPLVSELDQLQHELQEGPCVDAIVEHPVYRTGDLGADPRWPRFGERAAAAGVTSMLTFRLFTSNTVIGALNLYSWRAHAFGEEAERIGELFAAHAAVALAGSRGLAQLQVAVETRDVIGMAKGILMERHGVEPSRAFEMLVQASQHANMKLRDVAAWLVKDGCATQGR
jgi:hypothetical protein